jgi:hypothetical protein
MHHPLQSIRGLLARPIRPCPLRKPSRRPEFTGLDAKNQEQPQIGRVRDHRGLFSNRYPKFRGPRNAPAPNRSHPCRPMLEVPPIRPVRDLHPQVNAPCRAHQKKEADSEMPSASFSVRKSEETRR